MKEAILKIQIDDRQEVSVFAAVDGVEERIFWSSYPLKKSFKDATTEARKWLLELRKAENGNNPDA
jgi:hypothetical protein